MPWVRACGRSVEVPAGSTLLDAVRAMGLPIAIGCGAGGLCGRCGLVVESPPESLSAEQAEETATKQRNRVPENRRLACRARVWGDVRITAPYW
ncbi:MAG: 2Fe-2S iron-sulfur cluster-binding protein [Gammaproteobacteria bacterium]